MIKYDVLCPMCCGCFHETNGYFRLDVPAKGHMFTAKQQIRDAGWTTFPEYESTEYDNVCCPSCGTPYLNSLGRVQRLDPAGECEMIADETDINAKMDALFAEYEPDIPDPVFRNDYMDTGIIESASPEPSLLSVMPDKQMNDRKKPCPVCGERFRTMHLHMRAKHPDYEAV